MLVEAETLSRVAITGSREEILPLLEWMGNKRIYCKFLIYGSDQYYEALFEVKDAQRIIEHLQ